MSNTITISKTEYDELVHCREMVLKHHMMKGDEDGIGWRLAAIVSVVLTATVVTWLIITQL